MRSARKSAIWRRERSSSERRRHCAHRRLSDVVQRYADEGAHGIGPSRYQQRTRDRTLTSFSDVSKLENIVAARQNTQDTLGKFSVALATRRDVEPLRQGPQGSGERRRQGARQHAGSPPFQVYEKTGIVPEVVQASRCAVASASNVPPKSRRRPISRATCSRTT